MAPQQYDWIILHFILLTLVSYKVCSAVQLKLTNLECESLDQSLLEFRECRLKVISRGVPALNVYAEISRPLNAIVVNFAIYKKASGYKPFLYNKSINFCEFMEKPTTNMLYTIFFNLIAEYSNLNHTCPYNALIVQNLVLTEDKFRLMPLPTGEYMMKLILITKGNRFGIANTYFSLIE